MRIKTTLAIDRTTTLDINGSSQRIRVCAAREGLPPLLVVQAGPALPVLHELAKFQRLLNLEQDFLVGYWEQRGCGDAPRKDANSASWRQQIDDLRSVLTWFHGETKQGVIMLGISIGGTMALRAAEHEASRVKAVVAISPDSHTAGSDAASYDFLQDRALRGGSRRLSRRVAKLKPPPYLTPAALQRRTGLLADLGTIEHERTFGALLREMLVGMVGVYGIVGTMRALRNINLVLRRLLPEIVSLDLFANPPRLTMPVHYVFGEQDALNPPSIADRLPAAIAAPGSMAVRVPDAGHMVHFDRPDVVRSVVERA